MRGALLALGLVITTAQAAEPLSPVEASTLLQNIADSSIRHAYQGVFVLQHGDSMQTLRVSNRPNPDGKESRLVGLDGEQREVLCTRGESVTIVGGGNSARLSRRLGSRHFPDLLPPDAAQLVNWYEVRLAGMDRVAGQECQQVRIDPRDQYRWGYVLCVEEDTHLPLRAVLVDHRGRPLMRYTFTELKLSAPISASVPLSKVPHAASGMDAPRMIDASVVEPKFLPPGFARIAAVKRSLAKQGTEVEHWVFSDGLTHVSMFVEPLSRPDVTLKGASQRGMMNLLTRRVGPYQVTVLGDAPWLTVDLIARSVELAHP